MFKKFALGLCLVFSATALHAASLASDNAAAAPYADGWTTGDNGGTGFGAWNLIFNNNGGNYIGATGQGASPSFGIYSPASGDLSLADRNFTGALSAGQSFTFNLGATGVANGGVVGMNLFSGSTAIFTFKFTGGTNFWQLNDGGTDFDTNIPFAANTQMSVSFTYNGGTNSYNILITQGATSYVGNSYTAGSNLTNITGYRFFSSAQGNNENLGFNNLAVVPEPATVSLIAGPALLGLFALARRRRS